MSHLAMSITPCFTSPKSLRRLRPLPSQGNVSQVGNKDTYERRDSAELALALILGHVRKAS